LVRIQPFSIKKTYLINKILKKIIIFIKIANKYKKIYF